MKAINEIKNFSAEFKQNWLQYLVLFTGISVLNQFVFIPFFRY
nr:glycerophosphoryl diester phosphodiesterase membrane domain-containing protein [Lactobacillus amylovorus]